MISIQRFILQSFISMVVTGMLLLTFNFLAYELITQHFVECQQLISFFDTEPIRADKGNSYTYHIISFLTYILFRNSTNNLKQPTMDAELTSSLISHQQWCMKGLLFVMNAKGTLIGVCTVIGTACGPGVMNLYPTLYPPRQEGFNSLLKL
jgi:hypothetical protein